MRIKLLVVDEKYLEDSAATLSLADISLLWTVYLTDQSGDITGDELYYDNETEARTVFCETTTVVEFMTRVLAD